VASASSPVILTDHSIHRLRQRQRRAFALCGAASLLVHLLVLTALPGFESVYDAPDARILEVVLLPPTPLPAVTPEPAVPPAPESLPQSTAPKSTPRAETRVPDKTPRPPSKPPGKPQLSEARPELPEQQAAVMPPAAPPAIEPGTVTRGTSEVPSTPAKPAITPPAFQASYLRNPAPRYPLIARRNGEQGTVTLRVLVTREGVPARVTVEQTSGSRALDAAALETVKTWRFVPARRGGEEIEAWVLVPIVFRLESAS